MMHNISYRMTQFNIPSDEILLLTAYMQREFGGFQSEGYKSSRVGGVFMPPVERVIEVTDDLETFASRFIAQEYIPKGVYSVGRLIAMDRNDFNRFTRGIVHPGLYKGELIRLSDKKLLEFCVGDLMNGNINWRGSKAVEQ